ncbi:MAG: hypothetical protein KGL39_49330 [Patescibacteria group bacterium]|nr:hypothetical protein [Patescibacteria group bacterium]
MTPQEIKTICLKSLRAAELRGKGALNEGELLVVAQQVFGKECSKSILREILSDLEDTSLVNRSADGDGVLPDNYSLTLKGQNKAKLL